MRTGNSTTSTPLFRKCAVRALPCFITSTVISQPSPCSLGRIRARCLLVFHICQSSQWKTSRHLTGRLMYIFLLDMDMRTGNSTTSTPLFRKCAVRALPCFITSTVISQPSPCSLGRIRARCLSVPPRSSVPITTHNR